MTLNAEFWFSSPLEVVKVTKENIQEAAAWCGGQVHETESNRVKGRMDKYILVPTPKSSATSWAFPGMYITKRLVVTEKDTLKSTFSVFRRDYFEKNTFKTLDEASEATWIRAEKERIEASRPTAVASAMGEALTKADLPQVKAPDGVIDSEGHLVAVAGVNSAIVTQREIAREEIVEAEVRSIGVDVSNPFDLPGEGGPDA